MQGKYLAITDSESLALAHKLVDDAFGNGWFKLQIKEGGTRSLPQNDLFHIWCRVTAKHLGLKGLGSIKPEDQSKLVFKSMFLGYRDIVATKHTTIPGQLRKTSDLDKSEMHYFMSQVQEWCAEKGIPLASTGEYAEYKESQIK